MFAHLTQSAARILAVIADTLAVLVVCTNTVSGYAVGTVLHVVATWLAGWAPDEERSVQRSAVPLELARVCAFVVPLVGPVFALTLHHRLRRTRKTQRRSLFDSFQAYSSFDEKPPAKTPFTGDFEHDVEVVADAESYAAILQFGTREHKSSTLQKLAALGEPHHMALLRQCLLADDPEVRLLANGQLERVELEHLATLEAAFKAWEEHPEDPARIGTLAEAHHALARSRVLDEATSAWHAREAMRLRALGGASAKPAVAPEGDEATEPRQESGLEALLVEAFDAYAARDFPAVLAIGRRLEDAGHAVPEWIGYLSAEAREGAA